MIEFGRENENVFTMPLLLQIYEEEYNELRLRVALPQRGNPISSFDEITDQKMIDFFNKAVPICPDKSEIYEIVFENYILHIVRNESCSDVSPNEVYSGKYFMVYEKSNLLDLLPNLVEIGLVDAWYPDGYTHYGVYCQNHIIDIIAADKPEIRKIDIESINK